MALNDQEPTLSLMPRARAAARRAMELRPGLPEVLASLGCVRSVFEWEWEAAAQDFQHATRRQPGSPTAHYLYAVVNLGPRGIFDEALDHLKQALHLDPVSPVLWRDVGLIHFLRRDFDQAELAWQEAERIAPAYRGALFWRGRLQLATGRYREALQTLEARQSAAPANTRVLATIGYAVARAGDNSRGQAILDNLTNSPNRVPPLDLAILHLGFGDHDKALSFLETACQQRAATLYQFAVDPLYDEIRDHPRAEAIRLAIGLPRVAPR
jgi:serine/threonine-protein kinase